MHKKEYKKVLIDIRNNILDYRRLLNNESIDILENSFLKQKEYLDSVTFNLISSNNIYLNNIGNFIAYKLLKKSTNKNLIDISLHYYEQFEDNEKEIQRLSTELEKISMVLNFVDDLNDKEFEKYMSYKID